MHKLTESSMEASKFVPEDTTWTEVLNDMT
jgi:hypothetical protein